MLFGKRRTKNKFRLILARFLIVSYHTYMNAKGTNAGHGRETMSDMDADYDRVSKFGKAFRTKLSDLWSREGSLSRAEDAQMRRMETALRKAGQLN